jgi:hypothetical protein
MAGTAHKRLRSDEIKIRSNTVMPPPAAPKSDICKNMLAIPRDAELSTATPRRVSSLLVN